MSFLGGAECSTGANPLAQFSKVGQQDTSLQRDRLVGRGPGAQESMRSQVAGPGQENVSKNAKKHIFKYADI
jgi:peroxin-5